MKFAGSRPNIKISVLGVTGLKNLGRVGIHFFNCFFFLETKYNLMHFERHFVLYFFQKKLKKISRFHQKIKVGSAFPFSQVFFYLAL